MESSNSMPRVYDIRISKKFLDVLDFQSPQYREKVWDAHFLLLNRIKNGDLRNICEEDPVVPGRTVFRIRVGHYDEHTYLLLADTKAAFIGIKEFKKTI